ncbi:hypothetical protein [Gordonia sp. NPDC127522]|uniref:hypothetical protein n=1 Tax=Gordonia sp. NPDC127522 TaxID=3345390 RepID=UPI0036417062
MKVGNPIALIAGAETLGGEAAAHAVVSRIRPGLLVLDLDGCADVVTSHVLDAADLVDAPLVHMAASGSPDSVHMIFAPRSSWARSNLTRAIDEIRMWAGHDSRAVDILTPTRYLRLPGSASLKPDGGLCYPIDVDGSPLSPAAAAIRAQSALDSLGVPETTTDYVDTNPQQPSSIPVASDTVRMVRTASAEESRIVVTDVAPRAWRRRARFTAADWRLLTSRPAVGQRSDRATEAAWRLWQSGIRDWSMASWYYRNCDVFEKFSVRDKKKPGSSRAHWDAIVARARAHRPPPNSTDNAVVARVRNRITTWTDRPAQAIAMLAVLEHRFTDGHGLVDRPIAVRDLMSWLNLASLGTAKSLLDDLVANRALELSTPYGRSAPREASRYTLLDPQGSSSRTHLEHDVTMRGAKSPPLPLTEGEPLSPVWGLLGAACWRIYSHLLGSAAPTTSATLAEEVGLKVGTRRSGCLRLLDVLVQAQLVKRTGQGRATRWLAVGGEAVRAAEVITGARDRLKAVRTRINAERSSWHAETRTEFRKAQRALHHVLDGLRERPSRPPQELDLTIDDEYSTAGLRTARPPGLARRARPRRRPPGRARSWHYSPMTCPVKPTDDNLHVRST